MNCFVNTIQLYYNNSMTKKSHIYLEMSGSQHYIYVAPYLRIVAQLVQLEGQIWNRRVLSYWQLTTVKISKTMEKLKNEFNIFRLVINDIEVINCEMACK